MPQESSQYHAPITGLDVVTCSARSTAAWFVIRWLKYKMIGMPTPYVCRYPSMISVLNVEVGVSVRNVLVLVAAAPPPATAVAVTVYDVDTLSAQVLCQAVRSAE